MVDRLVAVDDADYRLPEPVLGALLTEPELTATIADAISGSGQAPAILAPDVATDRDRITRLFQTTLGRVAVGRRGLDYDLYQELAPSTWWITALDYDSTPNGTHHSMWQSSIGVPVLSVDQTDASWAFTVPGPGWVTSANANAYGGSYIRNDGNGAVATWTTPVATVVGLRAFRTTNGGYAKVTIDGSATAATSMPTAQDEVAAGRLAASALIANGGTLNPNDRLYSSLGPTSDSDVSIILAQNLPSQAHTVVLTNTAYAPAGSTGVRLYVSGGFYSTPDTLPSTQGATMAPLVTILANSSVSEYAFTYKRTGGTLAPFIGNRHGNEVETSFGLIIDGQATSVSDGAVVYGSVIEAVRTTNLLNPDNAAEVIGTGRLSWIMTPQNGLDVHWKITFSEAGECSTGYTAMLPTQGNLFARGRAAGGPNVTLLDDNNSVKGSTKSDTLVLWQDKGRGAVMATVRNLATAVRSWQNTVTSYAWLQDRSGGDFNKGYFQRVQGPGVEVIAPGDVWEAYVTYRAAWMPTTAVLEG